MMKEVVKMFLVGGLLVVALVLVFGFSVNGKLGSVSVDFSINGIPRYETVSFNGALYLVDRRSGETKLVASDTGSQLGTPFKKMNARPGTEEPVRSGIY